MKLKWIRWIFILIGVLLFIFLSVLSHWSPQKTDSIYNNEGQIIENSISKIENIEINGVSQRVVIRGWDKNNPVLLHLHGGPGNPDRPFIRRLNAHVEDLFTVIYWDQRGIGGSYHKDIEPHSISLVQIADDGIVISEYFKERFNKDKIYIQGHSWGTAVGITMAQKRPDLFHAYIGIGQMASSARSEKISYQYALEEAHKAHNEKDIKVLNDIGSPPYLEENWIENMLKQRQILWKYENPENPVEQSMFQIYMVYIMHPEYSIFDKIGMLKGAGLAMKYLWDDAMNIDFFKTVPNLDLPIYIIQGKYDKHTSTVVAKTYFDSLNAPLKQYFEFEKSAHAPHFEEYNRYKKILREEVLKLN
ncbi:MAG: alpha/beta hydrolase [Saprospiraceae bacterium]|nr:alpha/beta hydrolase [Saprospiraceae bacterium]|tara:strand:+ start:3956 stop:5038 length:1083 start_codon:yes stop_codon:yes gene_type:complete